MDSSVLQTQRHHDVSVRIAQIKTVLDAAYVELRRIMTSPEQYSLDTGNTRQFVIKQRLPALQKTIEFYERKLAEHESKLEELNGEGGGVTVLYPLMR